MSNNYVRRSYRDVKNDFIVCGRGWSNGFFLKRKITAITPDGIWLSELTLTNGLIEYGFFEWDWIDSIVLAGHDEVVYFVMKDMEACLSSVCSWQIRTVYRKMLVKKMSDGKEALAVRLELLSPDIFTYIDDNLLVKIVIL